MLDSKIYTIRINGVDESSSGIKLLTGNVKQLNDLEKSNQDLLKATQTALAKTSTSYKSSRLEARLLGAELYQLRKAGDTTSDSYKQQSAALAQLKYNMSVQANELKLLQNQYTLFGNTLLNVNGVIKLGSVGMSLVSMFGDDDDYLKTIKNLVAVQGLVSGLSGLNSELSNSSRGLGKIFSGLFSWIDKITSKEKDLIGLNSEIASSFTSQETLQKLLITTQGSLLLNNSKIVESTKRVTELQLIKNILDSESTKKMIDKSIQQTKDLIATATSERLQDLYNKRLVQYEAMLKANGIAHKTLELDLEKYTQSVDKAGDAVNKTTKATINWGNLLKTLAFTGIIAGITALVSWLSKLESLGTKAFNLMSKFKADALENAELYIKGEELSLDILIKKQEEVVKEALGFWDEFFHKSNFEDQKKELEILNLQKVAYSEIRIEAFDKMKLMKAELAQMGVTLEAYYKIKEADKEFSSSLAKGLKNGKQYQEYITILQKLTKPGSNNYIDLELERFKDAEKNARNTKKLVEPVNKLLLKLTELGIKGIDLFSSKMLKGLQSIKVTTEETLKTQLDGYDNYYNLLEGKLNEQYAKDKSLIEELGKEDLLNVKLRLKNKDITERELANETLEINTQLNNLLYVLLYNRDIAIGTIEDNRNETRKKVISDFRDYQIKVIDEVLKLEILTYDKLVNKLDNNIKSFGNKLQGYSAINLLKNLKQVAKDKEATAKLFIDLDNQVISAENKILEKEQLILKARADGADEKDILEWLNQLELQKKALEDLNNRYVTLRITEETNEQNLEKAVSDFLDVILDINSQLSNLVGSIFEMQIEAQEQYIEKVGKQLEKANNLFDKSTTKLLDLRQELRNNMNGNTLQIKQDLLEEEAANIQLFNTQQRLEREKAKAEEKLAKQQKQLRKLDAVSNLITSIINTALGVTAALKVGIAGIPMAPIIGALGAIQTGVIIAQISKLENGGLLQGKSHAQGGIPVGNTGVEVEGGEYVVNKRSTLRYLPLLEEINANNGINSRLSKLELGSEINTAGLGRDPLLDLIGSIDLHPVVSVVDINKKQNSIVRVKEYAGY